MRTYYAHTLVLLLGCYCVHTVIATTTTTDETVPNDINSNSCNSTCNAPHGHCESDTCVCEWWYSGTHCDDHWQASHTWSLTFDMYAIWTILLQTSVIAFCCYELYVTFHYAIVGGWAKWSLTTWMYFAGIGGGFLRVFDLAVDPHAVRGIFPAVFEGLIWNIPFILWMAAGIMLCLYWLELASQMGVKELIFISRFRPYLLAFVIVSSVLLLSATAWKDATQQTAAMFCYSFLLLAAFVLLIVVFSVSGARLLKVLRNFPNPSARMALFCSRLKRYVLFLDSAVVAAIVCVGVYVVVGGAYDKWKYVAIQWVERNLEFSIVFSTLLFTRKRKPQPMHTNTSYNSGTATVTINSHKRKPGRINDSTEVIEQEEQTAEHGVNAGSVEESASEESGGEVLNDSDEEEVSVSFS